MYKFEITIDLSKCLEGVVYLWDFLKIWQTNLSLFLVDVILAIVHSTIVRGPSLVDVRQPLLHLLSCPIPIACTSSMHTSSNEILILNFLNFHVSHEICFNFKLGMWVEAPCYANTLLPQTTIAGVFCRIKPEFNHGHELEYIPEREKNDGVLIRRD